MLRHWGDIYYVVLAWILMNNMMVDARLENDEMENGSMYKTIDAVLKDESRCSGDELNNENVQNGTGIQGDSMPSNIVNCYKIQLLHKRWEALYVYDRLAKLQNSMKRHLYLKKHGDEALNNAHKLVNNYNPLSF